MRTSSLTFGAILPAVVILTAVASAADRDLLVSSRNTHSIKRYDGSTGAYVGEFVTAGSGGLSFPQDIEFLPDGSVLVSGRGNSALLRYDGQTGAFLGAFTSGRALDNPTKFSFGPDGNIYISQWSATSPTVLLYNGSTGVYINEFTAGGLALPQEQIWDSAGRSYIASYGLGAVYRFDAAGNNLGAFTGPGNLSGPTNLRWGSDGDLYVLDWTTGRERRFDATTGALVGDFAAGLVRAEGSTVGPDGRLYVGEWQQNHVRVFDGSSGQNLGIFAAGGGLLQPNDIEFLPIVPEPSSLMLLASTLFCVAGFRAHRSRA